MRRRLDGVLLLDKPVGPSSSAVLQAVKRLLGAKKAGHAGTLDPLASGLLPLLFGEATKFAQFGLDAPKQYLARIRLGVRTDTGDAEGKVLEERPVAVEDAALAGALQRFRGVIEQVPPMHSALKHEGRPLYALARAGRSVERAPRKVEVHELELLERKQDVLEVRVRCSKGTYIRQLAADLGSALGCGAHLAALRRTAVGAFRVEQAVSLEALEAASEAERAARLLPADSLLGELPRLDLDQAQAERFLMGQAIASGGTQGGGACRVYGAGTLLGIGSLEDGVLQPRRSIARG
jgi:tRNA pseudouridine55 synthase